MGTIGFVCVAHEDYLANGAIRKISEDAAASLIATGVDLRVVSMPITTSAQAVEAGRHLLTSFVDGVIIFLGSWVECPVVMSVIRELEHLPLCMWGFPVFQQNDVSVNTGSYVSFAMLNGSLSRAGYQYIAVLGTSNSKDAVDEVKAFCGAATVSRRLRYSKIGLIGYTSMGIYPGTFDHLFMRTRIGPEIEHIDTYSLLKAAEEIGDNLCEPVISRLRSLARIRDDVDPADLCKVSRMYLAMKELCESKDLCALNIKCQYELSKEYGMTPCIPLSLLADSGIAVTCEGDTLNMVSLLMLSLLSNNVCAYGDALTHHGNVLTLSPCGFMPYSICDNCEICRFTSPGFRGLHNNCVMRPERVTVMRLVEDVGTYHMLYFIGSGQPTKPRDGRFPSLDVLLDGDINQLVRSYAGQHFAICYGDYSSHLECLSTILGIKTARVCKARELT